MTILEKYISLQTTVHLSHSWLCTCELPTKIHKEIFFFNEKANKEIPTLQLAPFQVLLLHGECKRFCEGLSERHQSHNLQDGTDPPVKGILSLKIFFTYHFKTYYCIQENRFKKMLHVFPFFLNTIHHKQEMMQTISSFRHSYLCP